jgi:hypothetical protein
VKYDLGKNYEFRERKSNFKKKSGRFREEHFETDFKMKSEESGKSSFGLDFKKKSGGSDRYKMKLTSK